jgi:hypothetical protein
LRTGKFEVAVDWVRGGFGEFTVAECLTAQTVTVQRVYWHGRLVCSQQRTRESWANAGSTTTGVSGSTGVGVTSSHDDADGVADAAISAIDASPHGVWGVDMARNDAGVPCVTEINIGRFFTTSPEFFARAGFNMAGLYAAVAIERPVRNFRRGYPPNPIADGTKWVRGMDRPPVLVPA